MQVLVLFKFSHNIQNMGLLQKNILRRMSKSSELETKHRSRLFLGQWKASEGLYIITMSCSEVGMRRCTLIIEYDSSESQ